MPPVHLDVRDPREMRPAVEVVDQTVEVDARPGSHDLDAAIGQVAGVSTESKGLGLLDGARPEGDPLNVSPDHGPKLELFRHIGPPPFPPRGTVLMVPFARLPSIGWMREAQVGGP